MTPEMQEYVRRLDAESTVLEAELRKARVQRELLKYHAGLRTLRISVFGAMAISFGIGWAVCKAMTQIEMPPFGF